VSDSREDSDEDFDQRVWDAGNHPAFHYLDMLADRERMRVYRQAIEAVVQPGDVVADLGTGLGVLALMALNAGASYVYAIDLRPASLWLARKLAGANSTADRIRFIRADVRTVSLERRVDVIVNELVGNFGTDEGIHESVKSFAARNLVPGGRIVPERLRTQLVPVEYGRDFHGVFRADNEGLDLRPALHVRYAPRAILYTLRDPPKELAPPATVEEIHFSSEMPNERNMEVALQFSVDTPGSLQGFVGSFDCTLAPGIELTTWPASPSSHWQHWHWPVIPPVEVDVGDSLSGRLRMRVDPSGTMAWVFDWER
jgi:protein arginine N-methyltransferase 1